MTTDTHQPPTANTPGTPDLPSTRAQRRAVPFAMFLTGSLAFLLISLDVVNHGYLWHLDRALAIHLYEHLAFPMLWPAAACSALGDPKVIVPVAVFVGGWMVLRRQWRCLIVWAVGLSGTVLLNTPLKILFALPRPYDTSQFVLNSGYTYPSGHTMGATIAAGMAALLWMRLKPRSPNRRLLAATAAAAIGVLEAAALTCIGVHYLSDVLAALAVSLAWLAVMRAVLPPTVPSLTPHHP